MNQSLLFSSSDKLLFRILFLLISLVYIAGLLLNVMEVDAAQYANISAEMARNHSYLQVFYEGKNYLDKPPLLFWLSSLSIQIFGVSNAAYKLPAFLFTLLGVYSTLRLTKKFYDETTAHVATLMVYSCQAFFLFNDDVRADTILTGAVIFAAWQLLLFYEEGKWKNFFLGFMGVALAMLAKGPIGLVVPGTAIFLHLIYKREWRKIFWWKWYAGFALLLLLLSPMIYGLYKQWGSDGIKFFFWTQSFGRITGENTWKNDAGYFFFTHTFLWAFMPWSLIAIFALLQQGKFILKERATEAWSLGGFVLPFIALSFSHYKLPHYIFVVFPFAAILSAQYVVQFLNGKEKWLKRWSIIQLVVSTIIFAGIFILCIYFFPLTSWWQWVAVAFLIIVFLILFFKLRNGYLKIVAPSVIAMIVLNYLMHTHISPQLFQYQSGNQLAEIVKQQDIPKENIRFYHSWSNALEFYLDETIPQITDEQLPAAKEEGEWVIGNDALLKILNQKQITPKQIFSVNDYPVSRLTYQFLDPKTRMQQVKKMYLVGL